MIRINGLLRGVSSTALEELVGAGAVGLAGALIPGGPVVAAVLGATAKQFVEELAKQISALERKVDKLLLVPLLAGLTLLRQGIGELGLTPLERAARNRVLDDAHVFFVQARTIAADSLEDSALILALDVLALATRDGHGNAARRSLIELQGLLQVSTKNVQALEDLAREMSGYLEYSKRMHGADDLGDKPLGYVDQRALITRRERAARRAASAARVARSRLTVLQTTRNPLHK